MTGERINVADLANIVAHDIFKWFGWEILPIQDENFKCHKPSKHSKNLKANSIAEHPVDVVFKYYDPYIDKYVYLNSDLKSYGKDSISPGRMREALLSLSKAVDCANSSPEWQSKYVLDNLRKEVRGMLFIYNHDDEYKADLMQKLAKVNISSLPLAENDIIHILDPTRILYLYTVAMDMQKLVAQYMLPPDHNYGFVYPELHLHKEHGDITSQPATIECLCSPYMILKYDNVIGVDPKNTERTKIRAKAGYLVYYNREGDTVEEFMYLFDNLSRHQILSQRVELRGKRVKLKIRVANRNPSKLIRSNFEKAKRLYVDDWGLDEFKKKDLDRIEFSIVNTAVPNYNPGIVAWKEDS